MLSEIRLDFFKCFKALRLPLRRLTLLSGTNASGKSTVLQTLVLLHQSTAELSSRELLLDGPLLQLGTLGDIVDKVNGRRAFSIGVSQGDFAYTWSFESGSADRREISVPLAELVLRAPPGKVVKLSQESEEGRLGLLPLNEVTVDPGNHIPGIITGLTYISAERVGPRETYPLYEPQRHRTVGSQGERAPGKLYWYQDEPVEVDLRAGGESVPTLYRQTQAWLADFFPGAAFDLQRVPSANLVTLGLRTSPDTDFHRPQHVGFGISHILPILVACLHARQGDLVIVENPEVHLHPLGQAKIGLFLARVAAAGVQVVVETHSDHVLNGLRRAVKASLLAPEHVALHFFQPRAAAEARGQAQVITPSIDREGNISHWPKDFFDQFEKDMNYFAGLGE